MATYLEIKKLLGEIFCVAEEIDEESDILLKDFACEDGNKSIILSNAELKNAFDKMSQFSRENLEMYTSKTREVAIQYAGVSGRILSEITPLEDKENGLTYSIQSASFEYCIFLLSLIADEIKTSGRRTLVDLRHIGRISLRRGLYNGENDNLKELLAEILRAYTLKIDSEKDIPIKRMRKYAASFEFLFMYRKSLSISEYTDIHDMFPFGSGRVGRILREDVDTPPRRLYNGEVLEYFTMAMESKDPFTRYISFYHVVEHYFDAIFRKKLTEEMRDKLTNPGFSYKSETNLYELAKYIKKHMSTDEKSGKGNEIESLKYVLQEYVPIDELKNRIDELDKTAIVYYKENIVPFINSNKTRVIWEDIQGVYTNLAKRIYETRNALVHSKSEEADNQYKPYKDKKSLEREMALIRTVAELVIINSSVVL